MSITLQTGSLGPPGCLPDVDAFDRKIPIPADLRAACVAQGDGERNLDRLCTGGALCVTTGQQPGLFTGPLYTIHKALSAVALARRCEALSGRPVVPVFWVAGDDHDYAESNHCSLVGTNGELERMELPTRPPDTPSTPMYREVLGPAIESLRDRVAASLPESEFRDSYLEWIAAHYTPEATIADAFAGALAELMGPYGLVVFRPTSPPAKRAARPHLHRALAEADVITTALQAHAEHLARDGREVPVPIKDGDTMVMLEAGQGRDRLRYTKEGFVTRRSGERFTAAELEAELDAAPERFSPNVLLRPVVEAAILPTIAYVAGPGERRYLAQTDPLYDLLQVPPQAVVTRWGGRVVEARIARTLERYDLDVTDLKEPAGRLEGQLAGEDMPADVAALVAAIRNGLTSQYGALAESAAGIDPTMRKPVEAAMHRGQKDLAGIERRIVGQLKQKNATMVRQIAAARVALFPDGHEQERVVNALQFLARYGDYALKAVEAACTEWAATVHCD